MPNSNAQFHAVDWLKRYFETYADQVPNDDKCYVSLYYKVDLFHKYDDELAEISIPTVTEQQFYNLWKDLFPDSLLRRKCNVLGKCHLCSRIQALRHKSNNRTMDEALRQAHLLHRGGLFMLERDQYASNIVYALQNQDSVMSIVMDGMDQSNCVLPSKGTQDSFKHPLHHKIQGVIVHGIGMKLYSSFDNVVKDTNLAVFAFLCSVENWAETHSGRYPEEIFLQVDGGPENISSEFLGILELLVHKRLARRIMYTRLPTGHTHCDIDGGFGHMKNFFKQHPCETLEDFQEGIRLFYEKTKLKPQVEFVHVVPDYVEFMRGCVDEISGYAKEEKTQHRWLFEAVPVSADFPFGVKTIHRNYASDIVVEFDEKDTSACLTPVGCLTGLEPRTTFVRWFPSANDNMNAGRNAVEGYYILRRVPVVADVIMKPAAFDPRAQDSFRECFAEICSTWPATSKQCESWTRWWNETCPKGGILAEEYVLQYYYRQPLVHILRVDSVLRTPVWLAEKCRNFAGTFEGGFSWPLELSACLNTVKTAWIRHPGPARFHLGVTANLREMANTFTEVTKPFYDGIQRNNRVDDLKAILKRHLDDHGAVLSLPETKPEILKAIKTSDLSFFKLLFRPLTDEILHGLRNKFMQTSSIDKSATEVVSEIKMSDGSGQKLHLSSFRQFMENEEICTETIDFIMALFQARDRRIAETHFNVNSTKRFYTAWRRSCFLPSNAFSIIAHGYSLKIPDIESLYRLYFPIFAGHGDGQCSSWCAVVVEPQIRKAFYVNPRYPGSTLFSASVKSEVELIWQRISKWLENNGLFDFELIQPEGL